MTVFLLSCFLSASQAAVASAEAKWLVPEACLRFDIRIATQPTDRRAGIITIFPDGGLLPRPYPETTVIDSEGNILKSACLWHNPDEGLAIVFARPDVGFGVQVYLQSAERLVYHTPESRLKPSLMAYVQPVAPGKADLSAARQLAGQSPPGRNARFGMVEAIRTRNNPLWREDRNFLTYYAGWLRPREAGPTWIATVSQDGSQFLVDGKTIAVWPAGAPRAAGERGQIGGTVALTDDVHFIEYIHFQRTGGLEALLAWRGPGQSPDTLPSGIYRDDYLQSGRGEILGVESRTGAPVPLISAAHLSHLWLYEEPVFLARFSGAFARENPEDTRYTWRIGESAEITGSEFLWLVEGKEERMLHLSVASAKGRASATRPFYLRHNTTSVSLDDPHDCETYRAAFLGMFQALPAGKSPSASWSENMWRTLLEVLEPYKGEELLQELFARAHADIRRLPPDIRQRLEDRFFAIMRYSDPETAGAWLEKFYHDENDRGRRRQWQMVKADYLLYDMGETNQARRIVRELGQIPGDPVVSLRAMIREGDIERLSGNYETARRIYSRAQDRFTELQRSDRTRAFFDASAAVRRSAAEQQAVREALRADPLAFARTAPAQADDWRARAVRESAHEETVNKLIENGYFFEARDAMAEWELEFPLHKFSGSLVIAEAKYHMHIGNYRRTRLLLENYREGVRISNFLPQAMRLELECLRRMNDINALRKLAQEVERRLPNHPVARETREMLNALEEEGWFPG